MYRTLSPTQPRRQKHTTNTAVKKVFIKTRVGGEEDESQDKKDKRERTQNNTRVMKSESRGNQGGVGSSSISRACALCRAGAAIVKMGDGQARTNRKLKSSGVIL